MRGLFVEICNDVEMAEAVDLLGGDLKFKLAWMKAEDSNWDLIRQKIAATADEAQRKAVSDDADLMRWILDTVGQINYMLAVGMLGGALAGDTLDPKTVKDMSWADLKTQLLLLRDDVKKAEIRAGGPWVDAFTSVCNDKEMAEAVDILGGDLVFKLSWMKEEGTNWQLVKEKLRAVSDDAQKAPLRNDTWRAFFVDICDNAQMAEAVALIGGDLKFKLGWMIEEGTDAALLLPVIMAAPDPDKAAVAADTALCKKLADSADARVFEALGSGAFLAIALIDKGGADNAVAALSAIAGVPANVAPIMAELAAQGKVDQLLSNCPTGMSLPAPAKAHFGLIYKNGNCTIPQRKRMIQIRYNVEISDSGIKGKTPVPWGQPQLDALYEVLGVFPDGSVITNSDIDELHLVVSGIGTYYPAYDAIHLPGGAGYNMATATWGNTVVPENHFLGTIRHEMGHAIDEQIGGEKWYTTDPNIDWDTWSSVGGLARLDGGARRLGTGQRRRRACPDPQVRQVALLRRERQRPARGAGGPQPRVQQVPGVPDRRHGDTQRARGRAQQLPGDAGHRRPRLHPPAHLQGVLLIRRKRPGGADPSSGTRNCHGPQRQPACLYHGNGNLCDWDSRINFANTRSRSTLHRRYFNQTRSAAGGDACHRGLTLTKFCPHTNVFHLSLGHVVAA